MQQQLGKQAPKQGGLDAFLGKPGGMMLMNLLAQQGYSPMPQSKLGAVGRAALMTSQQQAGQSQAEAKRKLMEAQGKYYSERGASLGAGGESPSAVREFEFFEGLSEEEKRRYLAVKRAQQLENVPGAGLGSVNPLTNELENITPESTIVGGIGTRAGAAEAGKQKAVTGAIAERDVEKLKTTVPEDIASTEAFIRDGREIIADLESGKLKTGVIRGQFPALTDEEQLFEVFSGAQILQQISSVTLGALSKGEMDFLKTTVSSRTKNKDANIKIIQRKIDIIEAANKRALAKIGQSSAQQRIDDL